MTGKSEASVCEAAEVVAGFEMDEVPVAVVVMVVRSAALFLEEICQ